jgi:thiol-disulfide isomerase/thioredoxin
MRVMTSRRFVAWFATALLAVGCTGAPSSTPPDGAGTPVVSATSASLLPTTVGGVPELDVAQFQRLMEQLRGTPVVLNLWASWCGPCAQELPHFVQAAKRYGTEVQFLGVDVSDSLGAAQRRIGDFGIPYPSVADPTGAIKASLQFIGVPDTIFFDARGLARTTISGPIDASQLQSEIRAILPAQASG